VSNNTLAWASKAKCNKYSFCPQRLEQPSQVKYLKKWLHLKPCCPETAKLVLPGPEIQAIQVTRFNFANQLHTLLTDYALCGNLDNLDVNLVDPFAKHAPPSGWLSTINPGASIYNLAYKNCCKNANNFVAGIILHGTKPSYKKEVKSAVGP
jgi:hypothetical protein